MPTERILSIQRNVILNLNFGVSLSLSLLKFNNEPLECVESFKYLGLKLSIKPSCAHMCYPVVSVTFPHVFFYIT